MGGKCWGMRCVVWLAALTIRWWFVDEHGVEAFLLVLGLGMTIDVHYVCCLYFMVFSFPSSSE